MDSVICGQVPTQLTSSEATLPVSTETKPHFQLSEHTEFLFA